jgi:hypothetical protein
MAKPSHPFLVLNQLFAGLSHVASSKQRNSESALGMKNSQVECSRS